MRTSHYEGVKQGYTKPKGCKCIKLFSLRNTDKDVRSLNKECGCVTVDGNLRMASFIQLLIDQDEGKIVWAFTILGM